MHQRSQGIPILMLGARWLVTGELDPWRLNLLTKWGREEMGCGIGDPPNAKTIYKKKKKKKLLLTFFLLISFHLLSYCTAHSACSLFSWWSQLLLTSLHCNLLLLTQTRHFLCSLSSWSTFSWLAVLLVIPHYFPCSFPSCSVHSCFLIYLLRYIQIFSCRWFSIFPRWSKTTGQQVFLSL